MKNPKFSRFRGEGSAKGKPIVSEFDGNSNACGLKPFIEKMGLKPRPLAIAEGGFIQVSEKQLNR
jgi:hypothetical protein